MWHYIKKGETHGPVSPEELFARLQSGEIGSDTLIWTEGRSDWVPVSQTEFQAHIRQQPVAAPKAQTKPARPVMAVLAVALVVVAAAGILVFALLPKGKTTGSSEKADDAPAIGNQQDPPGSTFDEQYKRATATKDAKLEEARLEDELQRTKLIRPLLESAEARGDLSIEEYLRRGEEQVKLLTDVSQSDEFREAMKGVPVAPVTLFASLGFAKFRLYRDLAQFARFPTTPFDGGRVVEGATADDPFQIPQRSAAEPTYSNQPATFPHPSTTSDSAGAPTPRQYSTTGAPPPRQLALYQTARKEVAPFAYITKPLWTLLKSHAKPVKIGEISASEAADKSTPQLILVSGQFGSRGKKGSFLTFKIRDEWKLISIWANARLEDENVCLAYGRNMPFTMSLQDLQNEADDWSKPVQVIGFLETNESSEPIISLVMYQFD